MKTWRQNVTTSRIGDGAVNDKKMHTYEVRPAKIITALT